MCVFILGIPERERKHLRRRVFAESDPRIQAGAVIGGSGIFEMPLDQAIRERRLAMIYDFLVDSYETERIKVISVWSEFRDDDLSVRPNRADPRGRSVQEQMVHQCVSEDTWFRTMLDIDVGAPPLPVQETRLEFLKRYAEDSGKRVSALREKTEAWWEGGAIFFTVPRSRAWIVLRRMTHTAHHRGQLMAMLRMLGRDLHSNYGPTADTGGLMQNHAATIYAYPDLAALLKAEASGGAKFSLPGSGGQAVTERPASHS